MKTTLNVIESREAHMIVLRAEGRTLEEIGQHYGITRERARQIIAKATAGGGSRRNGTVLDPLAVVAFARSPEATSMTCVANHFGANAATLDTLLNHLGLRDALLRLYRRRRWRRTDVTKVKMLCQVRAFARVHGRSPTYAELGLKQGTLKHPDLPYGSECARLFGSYRAVFALAGVPVRPQGARGHLGKPSEEEQVARLDAELARRQRGA